MSASAGTTSSGSVYTTSAFWERLWRTAGIQSIFCFIVAYIVYGHQPQVGASADALAAFYGGDRMRILIAVVFYGLAVLNLMWFAPALREGQSTAPALLLSVSTCTTRRLPAA